jgi:uncharacterized membrane protein YciS (DUF1049 family)
MNLAIVVILVFVINVPFGFWHEGVNQISIHWFLATHAHTWIGVLLRCVLALGFGWGFLWLLVLFFRMASMCGDTNDALVWAYGSNM